MLASFSSCVSKAEDFARVAVVLTRTCFSALTFRVRVVFCFSRRKVSGVWEGAGPFSGTCDVAIGNTADCLVTRGASSLAGGWSLRVGLGSVPAFELLIGENIPEAVRTSNKSYSNLFPRIFALQ